MEKVGDALDGDDPSTYNATFNDDFNDGDNGFDYTLGNDNISYKSFGKKLINMSRSNGDNDSDISNNIADSENRDEDYISADRVILNRFYNIFKSQFTYSQKKKLYPEFHYMATHKVHNYNYNDYAPHEDKALNQLGHAISQL